MTVRADERGKDGRIIHGVDLRVGDVLGGMPWPRESGGSPDRTITSLEPYPTPELFDFMDERWQMVHSGEWHMTLDPDAPYAMAPNGTWVPAHWFA